MSFLDIPEGTDIIEVRKQMNQMLSEARKSAKPTKCILCGNTQTSFCNSHSVPQFKAGRNKAVSNPRINAVF